MPYTTRSTANSSLLTPPLSPTSRASKKRKAVLPQLPFDIDRQHDDKKRKKKHNSTKQREPTKDLAASVPLPLQPPPSLPDSAVPYTIGQRVYCKWNADSYYWGTISQVNWDKKTSFLYTVHFDDEDHCDNIQPSDCFLESHPLMREAFIIDPTNVVVDNRRRRRQVLLQGRPGVNDYAMRKRHAEQSSHKKSARISAKKVVGARCYARFSNGQMYWGRIFHVAPFQKIIKYAVEFDDGDQLTGLNEENVLTELQYKLSTKQDPPAFLSDGTFCFSWNAWSPQRIFVHRCRHCSLCTMKDCGACTSCRDNQTSTTLWKRCCLFKMCTQIPALVKAQPVPTLRGFRFYTDEPNAWVDEFSEEFWPKLAGLKVLVEIDGSEQVFDSLHSAIKVRWPTRNPAPSCIEFYRNFLGLDTRIPTQHELVGKGFCREWTDSTGQPRVLTGEIVGCYKQTNGHQMELQFELHYNAVAREIGNLEYKVDGQVPLSEFVTEEDAVGAYLAGRRHLCCNPFEMISQKSIGLLPCHWLVPAMRFDARGSRAKSDVILRTLGYELRLKAKRSSIPNAGLGLWVNCKPTMREKSSTPYFVLPPGVLVDLGLYAPVRQSDKLCDEVATLKSFIHNWECGSWNFDAAESNEEIGRYSVFDITDDWSGKLHDDAKRNIIVYANEINRGELANLVAKHDPHGCVHYLLGHNNRARGPLRLPLGEDIELKVDYGPTYEKVRVRKGYARATKSELKKLQQDIKNDDADFLDSISDFSVKLIDDSLSYLENLFSFGQRDMDHAKVARAILAASAICLRLLDIKKEFEGVDIDSDDVSFCDGGLELMEKHNCMYRAQMLIDRICRRFKTTVELKHVLVSNECYVDLLSRLMLETKVAVEAMSVEEFVGKLAYRTGIESRQTV